MNLRLEKMFRLTYSPKILYVCDSCWNSYSCYILIGLCQASGGVGRTFEGSGGTSEGVGRIFERSGLVEGLGRELETTFEGAWRTY